MRDGRSSPQSRIRSCVFTSLPISRMVVSKPSFGVQMPEATKMDAIIRALQTPEGVTLEQLQKITGWLPHTVRGYLSGHIRKKHGHKIARTRTQGTTIYRIETQ